MFEIQRSGDKTSSGKIGLDIRTHVSPKVGQDQVSGGVTYSGVVAITLQKYEVLQIVNGGASGALVNATKDIVVNSGHYFLHVDPGYSRDHIEEQLLATDYWSKEYVVVSSNMETNEGDQVRIHSCNTDTRIEIDNGDTQSVVQLQEAGGHYDMQLYKFSLVIKGDEPIQVAWIGTTPDASNFGDPFLYMTTGTSHFLQEFTFLTPCIGAPVVYDNYIVLIADSKAAGHVKLDGILLSLNWTQVVQSDYFYAYTNISTGVHIVRVSFEGGVVGGMLNGYGNLEEYGSSIGK